ncbi:uncharacterized protein LOC132735018 isoform X5 [Ruditapes philippinarum]|uniref:uncharacterized protein LOC132735018 isoform X5 n=1 Tax=Ruditapes philippinarum TaxID=129788 RepID=UPI00295AF695|nr:uncharacterized protein LOC132735018 isoform X5 [Ruditapes philippinarum]
MLHNIDFRVYAYFNKLVAIINKSKHWTVIIIIWNSFVYNMMSNDNYIFCFRLTKMKEEFRTKEIQLKKEQEELRRVQEDFSFEVGTSKLKFTLIFATQYM